MPFQRLVSLDELPPGSLLEIVRGNDLYAICNVNGEVRAMAGVCPHHGGPLGQGALDEGLVTCPWHAWQFDPGTGACVFNDAVRVPVYPVRIEGGEILVDLPDVELAGA
jgi:nitrite reductase/ring-hydroxylating ferredoxin subunit